MSDANAAHSCCAAFAGRFGETLPLEHYLPSVVGRQVVGFEIHDLAPEASASVREYVMLMGGS